MALITEKQIRRGTHGSTAKLEQAISAHLVTYNTDPEPFIWSKTADQILGYVSRYCEKTNET